MSEHDDRALLELIPVVLAGRLGSFVAMPEDQGSGDWVESFKAWVWEPPYERWRLRGLSNATLSIRPGRFTIEAGPFYRRVGGWEKIEYDWPSVDVETLRPLGGPGLLFEMSRHLARCSVQFQGARIRAALDRAGFVVVEFRHWGWEGRVESRRALLESRLRTCPEPSSRHPGETAAITDAERRVNPRDVTPPARERVRADQ